MPQRNSMWRLIARNWPYGVAAAAVHFVLFRITEIFGWNGCILGYVDGAVFKIINSIAKLSFNFFTKMIEVNFQLTGLTNITRCQMNP